jgi:ribosomal protein L7/L12
MTAPTVRIPYEADAAMRRGEKLQAVKITREKLGLSLKDAKELCDAWSPNDPAPPAPDPAEAPGDPTPAVPRAALPPGELPAAAVDALGRGNRIEAIKIYREATGEGLRESKEAVEAYEAAHPELAPADSCGRGGDGAPGSSCGAGRLVLALFALGLIAAALYFSGVLG